jgi:hypothetical protein
MAMMIGGSVIAGIDDSTGGDLTASGSIRASNDIGSIVVKGSLIRNGNPNGDSQVIISARGQLNPILRNPDVAIQSLTIGGRVDRAQILGGVIQISLPRMVMR